MLASSRLSSILLVVTSLFSSLEVVDVARAEYVDPAVLDACPGYTATDVGPTLTAKLALAGAPCNVFGNDTLTLDLAMTYETDALAQPITVSRLGTPSTTWFVVVVLFDSPPPQRRASTSR
jgi:hypothetical protein